MDIKELQQLDEALIYLDEGKISNFIMDKYAKHWLTKAYKLLKKKDDFLGFNRDFINSHIANFDLVKSTKYYNDNKKEFDTIYNKLKEKFNIVKKEEKSEKSISYSTNGIEFKIHISEKYCKEEDLDEIYELLDEWTSINNIKSIDSYIQKDIISQIKDSEKVFKQKVRNIKIDSPDYHVHSKKQVSSWYNIYFETDGDEGAEGPINDTWYENFWYVSVYFPNFDHKKINNKDIDIELYND